MSKAANSISKIIACLIVVMIVLGAAGVLVYFLSRPTGMYVMYGDEVLSSGNGGVVIPFNGTDITFSIKNTDGWGVYSVQDCVVKIVPIVSPEKDFEFTVEGEDSPRLFSMETDYTAGFLSSYDDEKITVSAEGEFSICPRTDLMKAILSRAFGRKKITVDESILASSFPYFAISVTSPDGENTLLIPLLGTVPVTGVELDKTEVIL